MNKKSKQHYRNPVKLFGWIAGTLTLGFLVALIYTTNWHIGINYLLAINTTTVLFLGWDKLVSPTKITRIPERVLHALALIGGSPGALIAGQLFRHKTTKQSFQLTYWAIVAIQIAIVYWIVTSS